MRRASVSSETSLESGLFFRMHAENLCRAALDVRTIDDDLAVEATGAQQCGVEYVGAVGRCDQDDAGVRVEPVHLDKQLVERLLTLVMAAAESGTALPADRIDLVDEHDTGR